MRLVSQRSSECSRSAMLGSIVLFAQGNAACRGDRRTRLRRRRSPLLPVRTPIERAARRVMASRRKAARATISIPASPDLTDEMWDHGSTDGAIFDNIKNGVAPDFNMTPWKDQLKDDEIWNVVNYLRSIAKKK